MMLHSWFWLVWSSNKRQQATGTSSASFAGILVRLPCQKSLLSLRKWSHSAGFDIRPLLHLSRTRRLSIYSSSCCRHCRRWVASAARPQPSPTRWRPSRSSHEDDDDKHCYVMKKNKKKMVLLPPLKHHVPNSQLDQFCFCLLISSSSSSKVLTRSLWFWGMLFLAQMGFGVERVLRVRVVWV